ncbi:Vitamin B12 ABC transporter, B12-binding component BtuF [Hyphomicrobium sulfonivorans]|uniref:Vitamin B12 ABC transporter, B12-binding component BtuF n=1 Tax=Hyphomicrobium sulfonivorans TaxID=121290 RepID=A0A109BHT5_HYPSL|nr:Vitamin B12 ABC transporter, B12-binding component BtuF [Hyphomicrobium sulfonivorans]
MFVAAAVVPSALRAGAVTVTDALGRSVTIPAPPQRIVTIFSSNTELVCAIGLADRIVGIDAMTRYPEEIASRRHVGGRLGFSVDRVVEQNPDLVIVTPARQAANQLVEPMRRLGVPVVVLTSRNMVEVIGNIRLIGRATGRAAEGEAVAQGLEKRIADVRAGAEHMRRPRVVMITGKLGNGLLLVARPNTYTGDALGIAGTEPALVGMRTLAQVSPEAILAANPDLLLYAGKQEDLDDLISRPGWREMEAIKRGRTWTVSRAEWLIPGPRTLDGVERLAGQLRNLRGD